MITKDREREEEEDRSEEEEETEERVKTPRAAHPKGRNNNKGDGKRHPFRTRKHEQTEIVASAKTAHNPIAEWTK